MSQFFSKLLAPESNGGFAANERVATAADTTNEQVIGTPSTMGGRRIGRTAAAIAVLVVLSSAPYIELPRLLVEPLSASSWTYLYPYWGVALVSCVAVSRLIDRKDVSNGMRPRLVLLGALAVIIVLSPIWADRAFSLPLDSLLVALMLFAGVWFGLALDARQWAISIFVSSQVLVLASLLEIWLRPRYGISPYGDWMGVFGNRNTLAPIAGLGVLGAFGLWAAYRGKVFAILGVAASLLDLYVLRKSGNATTWLSLVAAFGLLAAVTVLAMLARSDGSVPRFGPRVKATAWACMIAAEVVGLVAIAFNANRSSSFDDRRHLWSYLWHLSGNHRWIGYGFGSFWRDDAKVGPISTPDFRWDAAHNSFVEIYVGMGLLGLAVAICLLAMGARYLFLNLHNERSLAAVFPAMIFAFLFMENLSESMILYNSSIWILLIAVAFTDGSRPVGGRGHTPHSEQTRWPSTFEMQRQPFG